MGTVAQVAERLATKMLRSFRRFCAADRDGVNGAAAIEFAIMAFVLLTMVIGVVDMGLGFHHKMQVQNAAQAGAYHATRHGFFPTDIANAVTAATNYEITASPAPRLYCGCSTNTGISERACGSTCPDALPAERYVAVSAQANYQTIVTYPVFSNSFLLSSVSTVKLP